MAVVGSDGVEGGDVVVVEVSASPGETRERRGFFVRIIVAGRAKDAVEGLSSARAWGGARIGGVGVAVAVGRVGRRLIGLFRHLDFMKKLYFWSSKTSLRANSKIWRGIWAPRAVV